MARVAVNIVTHNSADCIDYCLESVVRQDYPEYAITVIDNHSSDGTRERLARWERQGVRALLQSSNLYYARAHNLGIQQTTSDYVLTLNPDVVLERGYLAQAVAALDASPRVGSVNGRLIMVQAEELALALSGQVVPADALLDGAGLMMHRSRRPNLRGSRLPAAEHYRQQELIFGADGACALYRRGMLDDIAIDGEWFDEDFVIYREDVDLAWRAQLFGWDCAYVPQAVAYHVRGFRPGQRRHAISTVLKRHSVKNGWLLMLKNDTVGALARDARFALPYQLKILGGLLVIEHSSLGGIADTISLWPRMRRKREHIQRMRRRSEAEMRRWFT